MASRVESISAASSEQGILGNRRKQSPVWIRMFQTNRVALASGIILGLIALAAIFAPFLTSHNPTFLDPGIRLQGPSAAHPFGTDDVGRDVLTRVIYGGRTSLLIGLTVTLAAAAAGSVLGLMAGYYPRLDSPIMRVMDGLMAFPSILLAIAIMASLGPSAVNVFIALAVVYTPTVARLVRSTTLVARQQQYVESANAIGMSDRAILFKYIFPNGLSPLIVQCTFVVAYAIISEASLSYLGAGVNPETPTWGNMLKDGQRVLQRAWWLAVFPGTALVLTVLTLNLLGDGLRDALDPRSRMR
ncbi:MAG TPA: ABC transporter permease [Thermomicrobiales bacterium]|nr:ABC transporter permease [Thermomicrobiales bacterium]